MPSIALDNRTLLLSLVVVGSVMAFSMFMVSNHDERNGLRKWAASMALESIAWLLIATRGIAPDLISIVLANVVIATALAAKLAAVNEYRGLDWPRRQCLLPILAIFLIFIPLQDDLRSRIVYGSLIFGTQTLLIALALRHETESRSGRAWRLLYLTTIAFLPLFSLRAAIALFDTMAFATPQTSLAPNPLQLAIFVCIMALGIAGSIGFILMIKERADREIRSLAMIDSLTGVFNRRAFMERAEQECSIARRNNLPLAVLMIDVDHFKSINDTHGHPAGDEVLGQVARLLANRLRRQDTIGRYGGEEFSVLLPATDVEGAKMLAETLCSAIETAKFSISNLSIGVTVSIGAASSAGLPADFERLLKDADAALYQAKHDGRNRIAILGSYPDQPQLAKACLADSN